MSELVELLLSGQEVVAVSEEDVGRLRATHHGAHYRNGLVRYMPQGWMYPTGATVYLNKIQEFKYRNDDVMVMTFPKSGTTWVQEILWTMLHNPDLDNPNADKELTLRSPEFHRDMFMYRMEEDEIMDETMKTAFRQVCPGKKPEDGMMLQICQATESPRILKSHYPFSLMPSDLLNMTKIVYVAREPKDVMVSLFYFMTGVRKHGFVGTFEEFARQFMSNDIIYTPYWTHVSEAWALRHHPNMHFIFYEDLKANIMKELTRLDMFLDAKLTPSQLNNVAQYTSFSAMKSRGEPIKSDGYFTKDVKKDSVFFRKGQVGDWKNHMMGKLLEEVEEWTERECVAAGVSFPNHTPPTPIPLAQ